MRILLAENNRLLRDGIRSLLSAQPGCEINGEAFDGRAAVRMASTLKPDVIIMEAVLPKLNGPDATREVLDQQPWIKVLGISRYPDQSHLKRMMESGAAGFLGPDDGANELKIALDTLSRGEIYLGRGVAAQLVQAYRNSGPSHNPAAVLTSLEREVLQLIAEGSSFGEIASELNVDEDTVLAHRVQLMQKLDVSTDAGLTKYAVREGISTLDG